MIDRYLKDLKELVYFHHLKILFSVDGRPQVKDL